MFFYKEMYCDDEILPKKKKIIRRLKLNIGQVKVYTVSLADGNDLFDIMHCANFKQKYYNTKNIHVVGIAASYKSALELVQKMIVDFENMYGTYQFKEMLLENNKEWY